MLSHHPNLKEASENENQITTCRLCKTYVDCVGFA